MKQVTDKEYFSYPAISKSQLKHYDEYNPINFWRNCILNPDCKPNQITDALVNGKLLHALLLEPHKVGEMFEVIEDGRGFSSRSTKAFQEKIAEFPDKDVVLVSEMQQARLHIDTLMSYPIIQSIMKGAVIEKPYIWIDETTGLPCKCKLDSIKNIEEGLVIVEFKSTSQTESVVRGLDIAGWHLDAGMQTKAVKACLGKAPFKMVFIIQSNVAGEEHKINVRSIDSQDCDTCEAFVNLMLGNISKRYKEYRAGNEQAWHTDIIEQGFYGSSGTNFSYKFDDVFEALKGGVE